LGFAYLAHEVFDASFALGAFLAGMVLNESRIGHKVTEQMRPLRDIFAVIFFVSVGMLFNPMVLVLSPVSVIAVLAIIIIGKGLAALFITHLFKQNLHTGLTIAISLAQIGEFSFILAGMARNYGLMTASTFDLILAGAIISIALNSFLFRFADLYLKKLHPTGGKS
jgi:CPA2 family monovalent cation:H+ antiporter-2